MKRIPSTLISLFCLLQIYLVGSLTSAHPNILLMPNNHANRESSIQYATPNKRSFDRLETSPFDFGAYSKRYSDDDAFLDFYRQKKSFDRLEASPFDFGYKRKRSFDRLDTSAFDFGGFGAKKRYFFW